jgi:hypothetical protein
MNKVLMLVVMHTMYYTLYAQPTQRSINILRYNDNFALLKFDTAKKGINKLKYISLGKESNISFGGEIREQYQYFDNQNFGDIPPTATKVSVGQLWHRVMLHSNIEIGSRFRIFTQVNSTFRFFNPNPLTPEIDENRLSLHQAFIDYKPNQHWLIRVGRQEIGYGTNRLLTFREGPNTRLTFNAAIVKYATAKRRIDFLGVTPVVSKQYAFDDESFKEYVYGVYGTENIVPKKFLLDYYGLYFTSNKRQYNFVSGNEKRYTLGFRMFSQNTTFNYELEANYQLGTFNSKNIAAYGISTDVNYVIQSKKNIILGLAANYFTGDKSNTDTKLNTYNLIFSKPSYGLAAPIGSSNIVNVNPYVKISPVKNLLLYTGVYFIQRQSNKDGTYSPGMAQLRPTRNNIFVSNKKNIGVQYAAEISYQYNNHISAGADIAIFKAGNYVKETGKGLNITYLSAKAAYKF